MSDTAPLLSLILVVIGGWLTLGLLGVAVLNRQAVVCRLLFPLGAALGAVLAVLGTLALSAPPSMLVLPLGLPDLPFHMQLDSLSAFFLMLLGAVASGVSWFAAGYFSHGESTPPGLLCLQFHIFLATMALVVLAADAYSFMVMWESMALASFFLVTTSDRVPEVRSAAYLYLLVAHVGAIALLLCFGVLASVGGDYTFAGMRAHPQTGAWASVAFLLAMLGFGAKAGLVPLHAWLPEAHPAAPAPVSALMSAVMLKTAVYGMLRIVFDLLGASTAWWGVTLLAVGLASALFGVVFAAVQVDMKRLLAYSSIENIGLMFAGLGLALVFNASNMHGLAALALTAVLFQALSHGLFKSLLFIATGAVLHATGERNLGRLGGLMRYMPQVAWLTLIGALASAGLPPLGGFVAEWLLLQGFLFTPELPNSFLNMLIPVAAAMVALVAALASYTMVKFFGVIFLGQPREARLAQVHDASRFERGGMAWLALACIALGVFPLPLLRALDAVTHTLVLDGIGAALARHDWLLVPVALERASYGPLIFLLGIASLCLISWLAVRLRYHGRARRGPAWDCGFPAQTARMQDTAEGFGMPIRQIFEPFFRMRRELPSAFDRTPRYRVTVEDSFWYWLYLPVARLVERLARTIGLIQQGRISIYLLYSFITLIGMLMVVR